MLRAGIVGLPNVGKSTLFNALTRTRKAEAANYPFCTIEPNVGVVTVPDGRLAHLARVSKTTRIVPTTIEFVDIAGLVRGASQGEGLGNKFLQHIREVDAIVEVVRCFESRDVVHVAGAIDPIGDIETVKTELVLADLETVGRSREKAEKGARGGDREARELLAVTTKLAEHLDAGKRALTLPLSPEERAIASRLFLLTSKPMIFAANVAEDELARAASLPRVADVRHYAETHVGTEAVVVSAEIEAQLAELPDEDATSAPSSARCTTCWGCEPSSPPARRRRARGRSTKAIPRPSRQAPSIPTSSAASSRRRPWPTTTSLPPGRSPPPANAAFSARRGRITSSRTAT
jgi:ribosome-binding ATPase